MSGERARGLANPARSRRMSERLTILADLDFGTVAGGATATETVELAGVQPNDDCAAQEPADLDAGLVVRRVWCADPHVVSLTVKNDTGAAVTDGSRQWRISAYRGGP